MAYNPLARMKASLSNAACETEILRCAFKSAEAREEFLKWVDEKSVGLDAVSCFENAGLFEVYIDCGNPSDLSKCFPATIVTPIILTACNYPGTDVRHEIERFTFPSREILDDFVAWGNKNNLNMTVMELDLQVSVDHGTSRPVQSELEEIN